MNLNYVIIILVFILAIIELAKDRYFKGKVPSWLIILIIVLLLFTAVINIYVTKQEEEKEKYSKSSGMISGELKNKSIIYPVIKLGGAKFVWKGQLGEPIFLIGNDPLKVWIEEDQLKISTMIRGKNGNIIAKLDANEWQVTDDPNLKWDRNFDERGVEIINEKGEVVLQVQFDGESVQFAGIFYREDGWKVALGPSDMDRGGVIEIKPPNEKITVSFEPLFKYPSERHHGERR